MSVSRIKTWTAGDVLTAADLNAEFDNQNQTNVAFPLTNNVSAAGFTISNAVLATTKQLNDNVVCMDNYVDFATAISSIGSAQTTLLINTNVNVTASATVPSTLTLWFMGQGKLTISASQVVTINGPLIAPPFQIFAGSGTVAGFGAVPALWAYWWGTNTTPGTTDMTTAINTALDIAQATTYGHTVRITGINAVSEIDATSATADFTRSVKLKGDGRLSTRIVPTGAGGVLLNMMGSNNMHIEGIHFDSTASASQCAIFMARTTTSTNCNNNKFRDIFTTGSYTKASVVCNGSESSNWFNCRFENTNASANYRTFWSGGATGVTAAQSITTANGGTVLDTNNPNTDNKMFGVEFYAPFASAYPVRFELSASYEMMAATIVCGSVNNARLVEYQADSAVSNTFIGPINWHEPHFEVFGTGNTVHWLDGNDTAPSYFNGISSFGGYYNTYASGNPAAFFDYDRTNINEQPVLRTSTFLSPVVSPGSTGTKAYVNSLYACNFNLTLNEGDGTLLMPGFANRSLVNVYSLLGGSTRFVDCHHTTVATAVPTTGTYTVGETIQRETPVVGQPIGWKCTVSGTLGTLNGGSTTGDITINTNVLTVSSATGLSEGCHITVAGVTGTFIVLQLSGTTAYLHANADATVSTAAVAFSNATLAAMANL